ncbi:MAG: S-methyl-5-thioribose-1-phosphate isomerase [Planctomycetaceae bacterium]
MSPLDVIRWDDESSSLLLLDQTRLPGEVVMLECRSVQDAWDAIVRLSVRGAPAIGIAAAYAVCLAFDPKKNPSPADATQKVLQALDHLATSRPTAVNLFWALARMRELASGDEATSLHARLLAEAKAIHQQDRELCDLIGRFGADRLGSARRFLTHCNAGALATGGNGTALAPIYELHRRGLAVEVTSDETRPLLQGSRLTAWELARAGIPVTMITDSMAGSVLRSGSIDAVIVGADRITARGDVANKIGTYPLAVLANYHRIPFFVAAPGSTIDLSIQDGSEIPIEQRQAEEVATAAGWTSPEMAPRVYNPAFDVTPAELVTALISDRGVIESPCESAIRSAFKTL